ncbi:MAG: hypothetical protein H6779_01190 [Candidatus Nomurabacteria bacterium]|nr:hypothetical protein [Candidatus Nomurabacteria bacterium]USN88044.1 MAG: hypothetical protein H6779_01190 [Candidatus Nomurabacteria bacterium]
MFEARIYLLHHKVMCHEGVTKIEICNYTTRVLIKFDINNGYYIPLEYRFKPYISIDPTLEPVINFVSLTFRDENRLYSSGKYESGKVNYISSDEVQIIADNIDELNIIIQKFFTGELCREGEEKTAREIAKEKQSKLQTVATRLTKNLWIIIGSRAGYIPISNLTLFDKENLKLLSYKNIIKNIESIDSHISRVRKTFWYKIGRVLRLCPK